MKSFFIKISLFFIGFLFYLCSFGQHESYEYDRIVSEANSFYENADFTLSAEKYKKAFLLNDTNPSDLYNAACVAALVGKQNESIFLLNKAADNGWHDLAHLEKDTDLISLHNLDEWKKIIKKVKLNDSKFITYGQLTKKIVSLVNLKDYEAIWKLGSKEFFLKNDKGEFIKRALAIDDLLEKHHIKLDSTTRSTALNYNSINGVVSEKFLSSYALVPKYFRNKAVKILSKHIGYRIDIKLKKIDKEWFLSDLNLQENYQDKHYKIDNEIKNFFKENDSLAIKYSSVKKNKIKVTTEKVKNKFKLFKKSQQYEFIDLAHLSEEDYNVFTKSSKVYSVSFFASNARSSFFVQRRKNDKVDRFEFVFFDDKSNVVLISNGDKYAFYKINFVKKLKKMIKKGLRKRPSKK